MNIFTHSWPQMIAAFREVSSVDSEVWQCSAGLSGPNWAALGKLRRRGPPGKGHGRATFEIDEPRTALLSTAESQIGRGLDSAARRLPSADGRRPSCQNSCTPVSTPALLCTPGPSWAPSEPPGDAGAGRDSCRAVGCQL